MLNARGHLPAVKAVTAAQLSMASDGIYSVTLDEAIEAMRLTAQDMSVKYKETSLSVCIPLSSRADDATLIPSFQQGLAVSSNFLFLQMLQTVSQKTVKIPLSVPAW